jgi:hypothetical protein
MTNTEQAWFYKGFLVGSLAMFVIDFIMRFYL